MNFVPGKGSRITIAECQVISAELVRIGEANQGRVTPQMVVDEARSESSPLHDFFDWNQKAAAEKWRLSQAAQLIRSVDVIVELSDRAPITTRAFVTFGDNEGYRTTESVLGSDNDRARLVAQAKREMWAWQQKYQDLHELAGIFEAMKKFAA
jgi:hypothetical protein